MTTSFEQVLKDVFERGAEHKFADVEQEAEAIEAAKGGDEGATIALVYAYAPALRNTVKPFREPLGDEEARSLAVLGLLEAVSAAEPGRRLAGIIVHKVRAALAEAAGDLAAVSIPQRSLTRFWGILRRADGDVSVALSMAPEFGMTRETFLAIRDAVNVDTLDDSAESETSEGGSLRSRTGREAIERAVPIWGDDGASAEDRVLVEAAFGAVDDVEDGVIRDAYGFSEYRPLPDGVIAERRAMSRPTVQRRRASGLGKMRDALAVDVDA